MVVVAQGFTSILSIIWFKFSFRQTVCCTNISFCNFCFNKLVCVPIYNCLYPDPIGEIAAIVSMWCAQENTWCACAPLPSSRAPCYRYMCRWLWRVKLFNCSFINVHLEEIFFFLLFWRCRVGGDVVWPASGNTLRLTFEILAVAKVGAFSSAQRCLGLKLVSLLGAAATSIFSSWGVVLWVKISSFWTSAGSKL